MSKAFKTGYKLGRRIRRGTGKALSTPGGRVLIGTGAILGAAAYDTRRRRKKRKVRRRGK